MSKKNIHSSLAVDARRIIGDDTPFAVTEAYRSLYTNIMYLPYEGKCRRIVVTSARAGEGKTSLAINLAYTIATTSPFSRILLIDADMRSPRIAQLLNIAHRNVHGLSEFLAGIDVKPMRIPSIYDNLDILASGGENTNTTALLSSFKMKELAEFCEEKYDYVIIDTPPLNLVSDAVFFKDYGAKYILASRADFSDVNSMTQAIKTLEGVEANIAGMVLCALEVKQNKRGYGKSRYESYGYNK